MSSSRRNAIVANRLVLWLSRDWVTIFITLFGIFIALPWLAPVLMKAGAIGAAHVLYFFYSLECHQLPERAYYLFGTKSMYSLAEIQAAWQPTNNILILRQFVGDEQMGYKVAWCDRTTAMYGAIWLLMFFWRPLSKRLRPLPLWAFALLTLPITMDGGTYFVSDLMGLGVGFRETNSWLAALTRNAFPSWFYSTDIIGSFNWWMRLLTGFVFSFGLLWLAYPQAETFFADIRTRIEMKFQAAGIR
jgi:uncharacterized membrane protein